MCIFHGKYTRLPTVTLHEIVPMCIYMDPELCPFKQIQNNWFILMLVTGVSNFQKDVFL